MSVTLWHSCRRPAIADDQGSSGEPIQQIICELNNDLRVLIKANLVPLSFEDVPRELYTEAILGVYEMKRIESRRSLAPR